MPTHRDPMPDAPDFLPTASLDILRLRSDLLAWVRTFFRQQGYWEVQTPVLSRDVCVDAWLEPFLVPQNNHSADPGWYLQTSPEFAMKRLLVAGAEAIFQITPAFRREESGPLHNPEFVMLEWYRVGDTYHDQMDFTEQLVNGFLAEAGRSAALRDDTRQSARVPRRFRKLTYDSAFEMACGTTVLTATVADLRRLAAQHSVTPPASLRDDDRDGWLNLLLSEVVESRLTQEPAVFVYDYPASQSALARVREDDPPVAERFELYLNGIEICNGYQELTDTDELRRRMATQSHIRARAGLPTLPQESRLLNAMEAGLPECSGVALGFDRLLLAATGGSTLHDVMAFPVDRA